MASIKHNQEAVGSIVFFDKVVKVSIQLVLWFALAIVERNGLDVVVELVLEQIGEFLDL